MGATRSFPLPLLGLLFPVLNIGGSSFGFSKDGGCLTTLKSRLVCALPVEVQTYLFLSLFLSREVLLLLALHKGHLSRARRKGLSQEELSHGCKTGPGGGSKAPSQPTIIVHISPGTLDPRLRKLSFPN